MKQLRNREAPRLSIPVLNLFAILLEADGAEQSSPSETEHFTKYYNEWKGTGKGKTKNYDAIPRFYFKVMNYNELFLYTVPY